MSRRIGHKAAATQKQGVGGDLPALVVSSDVATLKAKMEAAFDMRVSEAFALALIEFVDATNAHVAELETRLGEQANGHP